jgi:hypothetical protein
MGFDAIYFEFSSGVMRKAEDDLDIVVGFKACQSKENDFCATFAVKFPGELFMQLANKIFSDSQNIL